MPFRLSKSQFLKLPIYVPNYVATATDFYLAPGTALVQNKNGTWEIVTKEEAIARKMAEALRGR